APVDGSRHQLQELQRLVAECAEQTVLTQWRIRAELQSQRRAGQTDLCPTAGRTAYVCSQVPWRTGLACDQPRSIRNRVPVFLWQCAYLPESAVGRSHTRLRPDR